MSELLQGIEYLANWTLNNQKKQKLITIKKALEQVLQEDDVEDLGNPALPPRAFLAQQKLLPEVILMTKVVNELLLTYLQWSSCTLKQQLIVEKYKNDYPSADFQYAYLDAMERCFRDAGWKVEYDKPGYNESYDAFFRFSMK